MGDVTQRRPDSTDPDLQPVAAPAETGHLPRYADDEPALVEDDTDADPDAETEPVEDGLQGDGGRGSAVVERLTRRPRDMIISVGVLLLVVFAFLGLYRVLGGDRVDFDPAPAYADAKAAGDFQALQPQGLGDGWTVVSAAYQPQDAGGVLRVGYQTPSDGAVQLIQGSLNVDVMLDKELGSGADEQGDIDINGKRWKIYSAREGETAYVLLEPGRTIIVIGDAKDEELRALAGSLR